MLQRQVASRLFAPILRQNLANRSFSTVLSQGRNVCNRPVFAQSVAKRVFSFQTRTFASAAAEAEVQQQIRELGQYTSLTRWLHWAMAGGIFFCFGTVNAAYYSEGQLKKQLLDLHESVGVSLLGFTALRVLLRVAAKQPPHPGHNVLENIGASLGHAALYAFMVIMPVSGVLMNYLGGREVQLFNLKFPGMANPDLARMTLSKELFKKHKQIGVIFEYFMPLHIGAAYYHVLKGHNVFVRVNPLQFAK